MDLKSPLDIVCLHGFLGKGSDWEGVVSRLQDECWRFHCPDYETDPLLNPAAAPLEAWGDAFHEWTRERGLREVFLVGYSQGGRLALHAWKSRPDLVTGGIFLSVNPGLPDGDIDGRFLRLKSDEEWAAKFESGDWKEVLKEWNAQSVFAGGGSEPERPFSAEAGSRAASALRTWSLAKQKDFRPFIAKYGGRMGWAAGEKDPKFSEILRELKRSHSKIEAEYLPDAGHRLLLDAPLGVASLLRSWFEAKLRHRV